MFAKTIQFELYTIFNVSWETRKRSRSQNNWSYILYNICIWQQIGWLLCTGDSWFPLGNGTSRTFVFSIRHWKIYYLNSLLSCLPRVRHTICYTKRSLMVGIDSYIVEIQFTLVRKRAVTIVNAFKKEAKRKHGENHRYLRQFAITAIFIISANKYRKWLLCVLRGKTVHTPLLWQTRWRHSKQDGGRVNISTYSALATSEIQYSSTTFRHQGSSNRTTRDDHYKSWKRPTPDINYTTRCTLRVKGCTNSVRWG